MEAYEVAKRIEDRIDLLEQARKKLKEYAEKRAKAIVEYDKQLAITMARLKGGEFFVLATEKGPQEIKGSAVSSLKDYAKGICYDYALKLHLAEAFYKNCIVQIEAIKAELNGFQSINRHLSNM